MAGWREIMRVREDHGVIYVRIPRAWAKHKGIVRGSYVVVTGGMEEPLVVKTFDDEVKNEQRINAGEGGGD